MKRIFRDLWIHMVFIVLAMVIIFKFSSAPVWFEFCENWLLRPHEETTAYEVLRIVENLSLAYIAALIFYIIVDYVPKRREEARNYGLVKQYITEIYANMSSVLGYFKYVFDLKNFCDATSEQIDKINNFFFAANKEWLVECDSRNYIGDLIDNFDGRLKIINFGKKIETKLEEFEKIALSKRIEGSLVDLMYDLKFSGLMEKMLNIFPGKRIEIKDMVVQETYLNLYYNLVQFEKIKNRLMEYDFEKQDKTYRKPSDDELVEWVKVQMEIRKKYPYVDDVLKQINNIQN